MIRINRWSKGSGKMEHIPSLNTNTLTNKFCQSQKDKENTICQSCYSFSMLSTFRKNCVPKFEDNSKFLSSRILKPKELPIVNSYAARFHSHGELINSTHFKNLISICNNQPNTTFSLWTKKIHLVQNVLRWVDKPKNLILIYSNEHIDKIVDVVPTFFDKVFNNVVKQNKDINCLGKCIDCMMCYTLGDKTDIIIEEKK